MVDELLSLEDASSVLGVSVERVRQLVHSGDLPGIRFGNAWAVPRAAVIARRQAPVRRGRPLGARSAWNAIVAGGVQLADVGRFRNRGRLRRIEMSVAGVQHLVAERSAALSGVHGAISYGELLPEDRQNHRLYLSARASGAIGSEVAAVDDPLGNVEVRVIPDEVWDDIIDAFALIDGQRIAPRSAVALDLMGSGDPRHWVAAESLVDRNAG